MRNKHTFHTFLVLSVLLCLALSTKTHHKHHRLGSMCKAPLQEKSVNSGPMWIQTITHEGTAAFNENPSSYPVYRNVRDYGAKGDGVTDDTAAINAAISAGNRCGLGCDSSTVTPALVFFPTGTYLVSSPIIQYYYTQLVGDAINLPTILAAPSFGGMAVIDADPYTSSGANWYTNQNNFYRQIRNFVIDLTRVNGAATGIHWQVAQATSLTNLVFQMSTASGNNHQGIFMDNGSGGFMSDLVFNGGKFGMWIGNQQFTSRNITINNAQTGIFMNWNWGWTFKTLNINNCGIGLDMSQGGSGNQAVGSIVVVDATITNTPIGVLTATTASSNPHTSGSLILDNIHLTNVPVAVQGASGSVLLAGPGAGASSTVDSWGQGQIYAVDKTGQGVFHQGPLTRPLKSTSLLNSNIGAFFERPKPQYENYDVSDFVSVKSQGAKGDGRTDDTAALQQTLNQFAGCKIIYIPAGTYLVTDTITVPAGSRIVGETWSVISATGAQFSSESSPRPMLKIGNSGDSGVAELSDLLFSTQGPVPGAILVEWNIRDPQGQQGASGMWDCHFRVGGALGTNLESQQCVKYSPTPSPNCQGAFALLHLTASSSAYLENVWAWTSDHDLDGDHSQISIYNARGILIESTQGPVWMYGTASEHNVMYQYNIADASNVFMGMIQTETPYYQTTPKAPLPFTVNAKYNDPDFAECASGSLTCAMAWGLHIVSSRNVYLYGAGLYNFFLNYDQTCLKDESCQDAMVKIQGDTSTLYVYNLNTKAAKSMVNIGKKSLINQADNRNNFCSTVAGLLTNPILKTHEHHGHRHGHGHKNSSYAFLSY